MKSENKNFLLNIIYQLLTFAIPFATVPYISRVLGVENVGIYSYTYSIVYMFMLVGMLGINNYGNRAIAAARDDKNKLSTTFLSIYLLQFLVCICVILVYSIYLIFFCSRYKNIAIIQGVFLLSVCFDINWFFFGIEKFKLTITRNFIIKILSLVLVFSLVKSVDDLAIYTFIMSGSTLISQLFLLLLIPKYISIEKICFKDILSHIKGVLILFIPVLAFGVYKVMDKTMIGALANVKELGYYENAEKVMNIPSALITALGTVMLPRMSYLLSKDRANFKNTIKDSMKLAMKMATSMCMGLILIADEFVIVLFGIEFADSASILALLAVTVIPSAWANVLRTQYLIPLKKDNIYVISTIGAASLNLFLNLLLIGKFGGKGACIGTIVAETFVALYQSFAVWQELDIVFYIKSACKDLCIAILAISLAYLVSLFVPNILLRLLVKILFTAFLIIIVNLRYILHDFLGIPVRFE